MEYSEVPDPRIQRPTDIIIKVTSKSVCDSDLHLYEMLGPYMHAGDIVGHKAMGVVQEVGSSVSRTKVGDRVVIPFNVSCGYCWMCERGLQSQCETTQIRSHGKGAEFLGDLKLYGQVPGSQAEYLRVTHGDYEAMVVAVSAMYIALFVIVLLGAMVFISVDFLQRNLRDEAGFNDYANLFWLSISMDTIGGAVGSSMSNAEDVRRATFSNREYKRRQLSLAKEEEAEEETEGSSQAGDKK